MLSYARPDAVMAVFLVTDGYSNGGDPRPAARRLREQGVRIFTFGIRNGNVKELFDMASVCGASKSPPFLQSDPQTLSQTGLSYLFVMANQGTWHRYKNIQLIFPLWYGRRFRRYGSTFLLDFTNVTWSMNFISFTSTLFFIWFSRNWI